MGMLSALAMTDEELGMTLEEQIGMHFATNCYPRIHEVFIPTAIDALDAINEGNGSEQILMPNGITKSAYDIAEGLRLGAWIIESELD